MTTTGYDIAGRVTSVSRPISATNPTVQSTLVSYQGDTVTLTDPQGKITTRSMLAKGKLGRTQDDAGYYITFGYDAFGSQTSATDRNGLILSTATYDYGVMPLQRTRSDADLGARSYAYDALGELVQWSAAKGHSFSQTNDALSRPLVRTEPDLTTQWSWVRVPPVTTSASW